MTYNHDCSILIFQECQTIRYTFTFTKVKVKNPIYMCLNYQCKHFYSNTHKSNIAFLSSISLSLHVSCYISIEDISWFYMLWDTWNGNIRNQSSLRSCEKINWYKTSTRKRKTLRSAEDTVLVTFRLGWYFTPTSNVRLLTNKADR